MQLSWYTDYGLRVLMFLSGHAARTTIDEIAQFFAISRDHVAKVVQRLARLGYIRSVRGIGGGIELASAAERVSIGQVIRDLEGRTHLLECVASEQVVCVVQAGCRLRNVLAEAERRQMDYLCGVMLSDVAVPGQALIELTTPERKRAAGRTTKRSSKGQS